MGHTHTVLNFVMAGNARYVSDGKMVKWGDFNSHFYNVLFTCEFYSQQHDSAGEGGW